MVLVAVIVGYILGVLPFVTPKIIQLKENMNNREEIKNQEEILDEYLNGTKNESENLDNEQISNQANQEDILKEYLTGEVTKGE